MEKATLSIPLMWGRLKSISRLRYTSWQSHTELVKASRFSFYKVMQSTPCHGDVEKNPPPLKKESQDEGGAIIFLPLFFNAHAIFWLVAIFLRLHFYLKKPVSGKPNFEPCLQELILVEFIPLKNWCYNKLFVSRHASRKRRKFCLKSIPRLILFKTKLMKI